MSGERAAAYRPDHCPTCQCEPVGPLPAGSLVDAYCPEHGSLPTAYSDCSCFRLADSLTAARAIADAAAGYDSGP